MTPQGMALAQYKPTILNTFFSRLLPGREKVGVACVYCGGGTFKPLSSVPETFLPTQKQHFSPNCPWQAGAGKRDWQLPLYQAHKCCGQNLFSQPGKPIPSAFLPLVRNQYPFCGRFSVDSAKFFFCFWDPGRQSPSGLWRIRLPNRVIPTHNMHFPGLVHFSELCNMARHQGRSSRWQIREEAGQK